MTEYRKQKEKSVFAEEYGLLGVHAVITLKDMAGNILFFIVKRSYDRTNPTHNNS